METFIPTHNIGDRVSRFTYYQDVDGVWHETFKDGTVTNIFCTFKYHVPHYDSYAFLLMDKPKPKPQINPTWMYDELYEVEWDNGSVKVYLPHGFANLTKGEQLGRYQM
jgi:hypothetical protein